MTPRTRSFVLVIALLLLSWAIVGSFIGCSNEKKQIAPPVVGPSAGSGPMGGGETQRLQLTASPSETLTTIDTEVGTIKITALVENSIGQPMPDGTPIYWSTTQGTITPTTGTVLNGSSDASITFPQKFDGCTYVTARSGDVNDSIRLCVSNIESTPTPGPTATPTPLATAVPTAGPTPTPGKPYLRIDAKPSTIVNAAPPGASTDITVCAFKADGNFVSLSTTVTLTITTGSGSFPSLTPAALPASATVPVNPCATFVFEESVTDPQTITIEAAASGSTSDTTVITVIAP